MHVSHSWLVVLCTCIYQSIALVSAGFEPKSSCLRWLNGPQIIHEIYFRYYFFN